MKTVHVLVVLFVFGVAMTANRTAQSLTIIDSFTLSGTVLTFGFNLLDRRDDFGPVSPS